MKKKVTKSSVVKKKSLPKAQAGTSVDYTMKDYAAQYPQNASDTLAKANPSIGGTKHFGTGKQQSNLEKAHTTKYGNPKIGMKAAPAKSTFGNKLLQDVNEQEYSYKKGGSVKKTTTMKKGGSIKKK